jgi:hypothetical protein
MGNVGGEVKVITIPLIFAFSLLKRNDRGGEEEIHSYSISIYHCPFWGPLCARQPTLNELSSE